jgi:hypothetical protein
VMASRTSISEKYATSVWRSLYQKECNQDESKLTEIEHAIYLRPQGLLVKAVSEPIVGRMSSK